MKKLSEIRAWVEWQKSHRHAGTESFEYLLGLIQRLANALNNAPKPPTDKCLSYNSDWYKEVHKLLMELRQ